MKRSDGNLATLLWRETDRLYLPGGDVEKTPSVRSRPGQGKG